MTESARFPQGQGPAPLRYQRCRFVAQLPLDRLYTSDHYWLRQESPDTWRVGLTPWAVRMLGDFVEYRFDVAPGAAVKLGDPLGALEGFKALVEIRAVVAGTFVEGNPMLAVNLDAIAQDCYGAGWLYLIQGTPDRDMHDAPGYQRLLDQTIDALRGSGPPVA